MTDIQEYDRQVVLVTGGGEGIGLAVAQAFAAKKKRVIICGRRRGILETASRELSALGAEVTAIPCDVTQKAQVEGLVQQVIGSYGRLDILVNNAGMSGRTPIDDPDDSKWRDIIEVNLTGTYLCSKMVISHMIQRNFGRIVNISSVLGRFGVAGYVAYCTAKHGLLGFTKSLALEVADQGVTVNAICPTWVDTAMARLGIQETAAFLGLAPETFREQAIQGIPMKRMAEANEIASLAVFLCSHGAGAITGQAINVCGGTTAGIA
ncbi:MAG: SDR family NAD(P)-dependent oxidoreductase [Nitrospirales bacterium]|nr:SDR family oxidoreductase [Nitrospirales bacterium]